MTDFLGDPAVFLQRLVFQIPALLIAVTVHELAHALVADRLGDPTARRLGRITLNPLPHIDPLGAIAFVIAGFGWAKPVPVDPGKLRNPRRQMLYVGLAAATIWLLRRINLDVGQGEFVTIMGPSGAGKTVTGSMPACTWPCDMRFTAQFRSEHTFHPSP